jgi:hypothetical protein
VRDISRLSLPASSTPRMFEMFEVFEPVFMAAVVGLEKS